MWYLAYSVTALSVTLRKPAHRGAEVYSSTGSSMHLSSRGEFGQDPARAVWPKGLSGPPLPLLPLRIEVGCIRLSISRQAPGN